MPSEAEDAAQESTMSQITQEKNVTVVQLDEKYDALDETVIHQFRDELLEQADTADPPYLLVDMSRTKFVGSSFVEILFRAYKRITERGGRTAICNVDRFCAEVLRATSVDTLIDSYPTRESALEALASQ